MNAPLERRLRRLELTNRILLVLALAGVTLALRPPRDEVLRARAFELVDADGRARARLAIDAEHGAGLFLHDEQGRLRLSASHAEGTSGLFLRDQEGTLRVGTAQFAHGGGGFALHGAQSKGGTVLYMQDGAGSLRLFDAEGKVTARFPER